MKRILFFICFLFFGQFAEAQSAMTVNVTLQHRKTPSKSDTVYYDLHRKLSWHDFKGVPVTNSPAGAITSSGFAFNAGMESDDQRATLNLEIYVFFIKHESWKKPGIHSAYHLQHEQHHFDITRLGAERLVKAFREAHFTRDNYSTLLNTIFKKVYAQNQAMQHRYDLETRNSIDTVKQKDWNEKISAEIRELAGSW